MLPVSGVKARQKDILDARLWVKRNSLYLFLASLFIFATVSIIVYYVTPPASSVPAHAAPNAPPPSLPDEAMKQGAAAASVTNAATSELPKPVTEPDLRSMCIAFRSTASCSASGERRPDQDVGCDAEVTGSMSGSCHCSPQGANTFGVPFDCAPTDSPREAFTCAAVCLEAVTSKGGGT
eukprot:CAMPEP_0173451174 /NCGR_PEP_ID=MMETSP1357-20121228/46260_1 /TAXON_ID=77926 /ORGANISM="Hemiselmis rufescens, Strain PCC563" /LENGTH=179 /DNA_ID=CAMNT_0014417917 /DNA_START=155 /DNA_END=690 /DNA_ORIENTATION=-